MNGGDQILAIARLLQPHGLRGEIYGLSLTPGAFDFEGFMLDRAFVLRPAPGRSLHPELPKTLTVESLAPYKEGWLFAFHEIPDRTWAERIKSTELCLKRDELPRLPEGSYWESDLEGIPVYDVTRGLIGHAAGLAEAGGRWSLRVTREGTRVPVFIPWANALIPKIDLDARRIETNLPMDYPGLDDLAPTAEHEE